MFLRKQPSTTCVTVLCSRLYGKMARVDGMVGVALRKCYPQPYKFTKQFWEQKRHGTTETTLQPRPSLMLFQALSDIEESITWWTIQILNKRFCIVKKTYFLKMKIKFLNVSRIFLINNIMHMLWHFINFIHF